MRKTSSTTRQFTGFTLVEVLMAAAILTVGFMGLIQAVTITSGMMDNARRQTLAAQILQHEIESLRYASWATISTLPTTPVAIGADWNGGTSYSLGDLVSFSGGWYRCIFANSGQTPPSTAYWKSDPPPYANVLATTGVAYGATYTLTRTVANVVSDGSLREATFSLTWVVATSRRDGSGNPVSFTYTRINSAYFGKYGLNLTYQRS